jgi:hydrogenase maturation protease
MQPSFDGIAAAPAGLAEGFETPAPSGAAGSACVVLGIGNTLLCDDGVGVHVIRALGRDAARFPGVELIDGGTLSFTLAGTVAAARALVIVDAADLDAPAGTVRVFVGDDMDHRLAHARRSSVHEVSLFDLMAISRLSGDWPTRRALVAIQPGLVGWGEAPSAAVGEAVPEACRAVSRLLRRWRL